MATTVLPLRQISQGTPVLFFFLLFPKATQKSVESCSTWRGTPGWDGRSAKNLFEEPASSCCSSAVALLLKGHCQGSLYLKSPRHWGGATKDSAEAGKEQEVTQITGSLETFSRNKKNWPESQSTQLSMAGLDNNL